MSLEALFTLGEPLGPIDQANIRLSEDADAVLYEKVTPFSEALTRPPTLLLGRKGSGKSAIIAEYRIRAMGSAYFRVGEDLPDTGKPFIITVSSWKEFHNLTLFVSSRVKEDNISIASDLVPNEYLSGLWHESLWDEIIKQFYVYCHHPHTNGMLDSVERYVTADGMFQGDATAEAKKRQENAKADILSLVKMRSSRIIILIDSMEKYPVRNSFFTDVLGGLLQAIHTLHYDSSLIDVMFCLPEEIEQYMQYASSNILKDFNASYRIRWRPIDLLKVVAHRYMIFAEHHDDVLYRGMKFHDLDTREGVRKFFSAILPKNFENSLGVTEDPLAYILRHTQLLPRHMIAIFNAIIGRSFDATKQFKRLDANSIRDGVSDGERLIAQQVMVPFMRIYPRLLGACKDILPDLPSICTGEELRNVGSRFDRIVEEDVGSVWSMLFHMGIIGRITKRSSLDEESKDWYYQAAFQFNSNEQFSISSGQEYTIHPAFAKHFGMHRGSKRPPHPVYPDNVDMLTIR